MIARIHEQKSRAWAGRVIRVRADGGRCSGLGHPHASPVVWILAQCTQAHGDCQGGLAVVFGREAVDWARRDLITGDATCLLPGAA
jgi:hypothetical protein